MKIKNSAIKSGSKANAENSKNQSYNEQDDCSLNATPIIGAKDELITHEHRESEMDYDVDFATIQLENRTPRRSSTLHRNDVSELSALYKSSQELNGCQRPKNAALTSTKPKKSFFTNSASVPVTASNAIPMAKHQHRRKPRTPLKRDQLFVQEVIRLQSGTDHLIPHLPFSRLVRELIYANTTQVQRITVEALDALHTASEMYLIQRLQDAYLLTLHRGRATLTLKDMILINYLRLNV